MKLKKILMSTIISLVLFSLFVIALSYQDDTAAEWDLGNYHNSTRTNASNKLILTENDTLQSLGRNDTGYFAEGIEVGLIALWHLDEVAANQATGGVDAEDQSGSGHHATEVGGVTFNAAGKLNKAFAFDGGTDYLTAPDSDDWDLVGSLSDSKTVSLWVKHADHDGYEVYLSHKTDATNRWEIAHNGGNGIRLFAKETNVDRINIEAGEITDTNWHHILFTKSAGVFNLYKDGALIGTDTLTDAANFAGLFGIAAFNDATSPLQGNLDEIAIWNRSLSTGEIKNLYDNQKGRYVTEGNYTSHQFGDGTLYNWTFYHKSWNLSTDTNLSFQVRSSDDNISFGAWDSVINDTSFNSSGKYVQYRVLMEGNTSLTPSVEFINLTYNSLNVAPTAQLYLPLNNTNTSNNHINISGWVNDTDADTLTAYFRRDGVTVDTQTSLSDGDFVSFNHTGLSDGTYLWEIIVYDETLNASSGNRTFTVDTQAPSIVVVSPVNDTHYSNTMAITTTISDTTIGIDSAYFNITNSTHVIVSEQSLNLSSGWDASFDTTSSGDGNYTITFYANDTLGNTNITNVNFTVDNTVPYIAYNPNTNTNGSINDSWIFVNVTVTEANLDTIYLYWNGVAEGFDDNDSTNYWTNKTSLADGSYEFYAWINDSIGNTNRTSDRNITIIATEITVTATDRGTTWLFINWSSNKTTDSFINASVIDRGTNEYITTYTTVGSTGKRFSSLLDDVNYNVSVWFNNSLGTLYHGSVLTSTRDASGAGALTDEQNETLYNIREYLVINTTTQLEEINTTVHFINTTLDILNKTIRNDTLFAYLSGDTIRVLVEDIYRTELVVRDLNGMRNVTNVVFAIYDTNLNAITTDIAGTYISDGVYRYSYNTTAATAGIYTTKVNFMAGEQNLTLYKKWRLESSIAGITIATTDTSRTNFGCQIQVTNDGSIGDDFYIIYWISDATTCNYDDACSKDSGSQTVFINPGVTRTIDVTLDDVSANTGDTRWCQAWTRPIHGTSAAQAKDRFVVTAAPSGEVGGGGGGAGVVTEEGALIVVPYDMEVDVEKFLYKQGDIVNAQILFYNALFERDLNVNVTYYLISPCDDIVGYANVIIPEIPKCNNTQFGICTTPSYIHNVSIELPDERIEGQWRFVAHRDILKRSDKFYVLKKINLILIFLAILFIVYNIYKRRDNYFKG